MTTTVATVAGSVLREEHVRRATLSRLEQRWRNTPETLVVEEFCTHFGTSRIDIAVVNGALWGYEIKSEADRLGRLPGQVKAFSEVFDYVTLVAAGKHMSRSMAIVPSWWGAVEAQKHQAQVQLKERRKPQRNTAVNPRAVASLLWRGELLSLLELMNADSGVRSASRAALIEALVAQLQPTDLSRVVRESIRARRAWRDVPARKQGAETLRHAHTSSGFLARRVR